MAVNVFVSYSHDDAVLVTPIVKLLRVNKALVFQDLDSIELGKKWREQAGRALAEAHLVVLFWCVHSSHSGEVESEYRSALKTGKDLLPVLLDATPLPADLSEFQWIDFRGTVGANHGAGRGVWATARNYRDRGVFHRNTCCSLIPNEICYIKAKEFSHVRSLMRRFKDADAVLVSAGERAPHGAEELAFEQ